VRISYVICAVGLAGVRLAAADPCDVAIVRAPAEVRSAVESALATEPHCRVALELRVVATEGGYYLLARDVHGHTRERIVPDTASAAVLVASWAADDESDAPEPRPASVVAAPPPPPPPATFAPPDELIDTGPAPSPHTARPRYGVYGVYGVAGHSSYGLRGEFDLLRRGGWSLGVAIAGVHYDAGCTPFVDPTGPMEAGMLETTNFELLGYASYERDLSEAWRLRGTVGIGPAIVQATLVPIPSEANITWDGMLESNATGTGVAGVADASLAVDANVGYGFWLVGGVSVGASITAPMALSGYQVAFDHAVSASLLLGLRHEL
jgi:hypothetical protein